MEMKSDEDAEDLICKHGPGESYLRESYLQHGEMLVGLQGRGEK